ncbi:hypothetical protein Ddye_009896 [Dipteronia dyeriana]|uniref:Uncharacterized protein n=1 Tax=Dipteronia dyeriana TaxID=168575 RepID=A0AAE0CMT6_9ROSI|nr:hypothetical protein Ddye_009896 [Dipteronia dyeriana]
MGNPNDINKLKEGAQKEQFQNVSSEKEENMTITTSHVSSTTSAPSIRSCQEDAPMADNQCGAVKKPKPKKLKKRLVAEGTSSSSTTMQIKKSKKKKGHILTIQLCKEDAHPNMVDQSGSAGEETSLNNSALLKKPKKKGHLLEVHSDPPRCNLCKNKMFKTWQGVAIQMKKHKLLEARKLCGASPLPVFMPPGEASPKRGIPIKEELASVLLNIAQQVLLGSTRPDGLFIDLNQLPGPSSLNQEEPTRLFDLNDLLSPVEEEEDEDEDKDHDDD